MGAFIRRDQRFLSLPVSPARGRLARNGEKAAVLKRAISRDQISRRLDLGLQPP